MLEREPGETYAVIVDDAKSGPILASIAIKGIAVFDLHIPLALYDGLALLEVIEQYSSKQTAEKLGGAGCPLHQGKKMKQQIESAKHQPVTIDGTSGTCTPTPSKIKLGTAGGIATWCLRLLWSRW